MKRFMIAGDWKGATELKRKANNHRSKHKERHMHDGLRFRKDRSLIEKKTSKYGVSTLLEENISPVVEEEE